jgi:hypothetical protein
VALIDQQDGVSARWPRLSPLVRTRRARRVVEHRAQRIRLYAPAKIADVFAADLRSLAAFRIVLAVVVLLDLANRASDLTAHYTDSLRCGTFRVARFSSSWRVI